MRVKRQGVQDLLVALEEKAVKLSAKELAKALKAAGLAWGRPTPQQVGEYQEGGRTKRLSDCGGQDALREHTVSRMIHYADNFSPQVSEAFGQFEDLREM